MRKCLTAVEAAALDRNSPAVGVPATIGASVTGVTLVYGLNRPFIYNRSPGLVSVLDTIQPRMVMTTNNNTAFQLSYSIKL